MIDNYNEYIDYIREILKRVPLMRTDQLVLALKQEYTGISDSIAWAILFNAQRNNYVLMSPNGWAMTIPMYRMLTNDRFMLGVETKAEYRIQDELDVYNHDSSAVLMKKTPYELLSNLPYASKRKAIIDDMWVVASLMPKSENFILPSSLWDVACVIPGRKRPEGTLMQIIRIPAKNEDAISRQLFDLPDETDEVMQKTISRIAIIDNPDHTFKIPRKGFRFIAVLDESTPYGYKIVEKRNAEEKWNAPA